MATRGRAIGFHSFTTFVLSVGAGFWAYLISDSGSAFQRLDIIVAVLMLGPLMFLVGVGTILVFGKPETPLGTLVVRAGGAAAAAGALSMVFLN
jgi:hypothetical protein